VEVIYKFIIRVALIAILSGICEYALPKGNMKSSAKKTLSLVMLLYIIEPVANLLGGL